MEGGRKGTLAFVDHGGKRGGKGRTEQTKELQTKRASERAPAQKRTQRMFVSSFSSSSPPPPLLASIRPALVLYLSLRTIIHSPSPSSLFAPPPPPAPPEFLLFTSPPPTVVRPHVRGERSPVVSFHMVSNPPALSSICTNIISGRHRVVVYKPPPRPPNLPQPISQPKERGERRHDRERTPPSHSFAP